MLDSISLSDADDAGAGGGSRRPWAYFLSGVVVGFLLAGTLLHLLPSASLAMLGIPIRPQEARDDLQVFGASVSSGQPALIRNGTDTTGRQENRTSRSSRHSSSAVSHLVSMSCHPAFLVASLSPDKSGKAPDDSKTYRLSDVVKFRNQPAKVYSLHYPHSLADEYLRKTKQKWDIAVLEAILRRQSATRYANLTLPTNRTLVVHLRIGDVIDDSHTTALELLRHRIPALHNDYVHPLAYYLDILLQLAQRHQKLDDPNERITDVVLVGGYHRKHVGRSQSEIYMAHIKALFEAAGYTVRLRLDCNADEDFVYMTSASHFLHGGGGYSRLVVAVTQYRHEQLGWNATEKLEPRCTMRPPPLAPAKQIGTQNK